MSAVIGSTLAERFHIEREVARGGMAIVYAGTDLTTRRSVAVKVLRPEMLDSSAAKRFLREVAITARLRHRNIVPLIGSGMAGRSPYYVMPYVDGESLRQRLAREGALPIADTLAIAATVARALAFAHEDGIIHRDVKPENILLSGGDTFVADFGMASAVGIAGGDRLTATGVTPGTPAYMSPEQAEGSGPVDARSDQYSLACVIYEMLTGKPPFTATSPVALLAQHVSVAAPSIRATRGDTPAGVAGALTQALHKSPTKRFGTMAAFESALSVR